MSQITKNNSPVEKVLNKIIHIAEEKKSENIRYFSVSEEMWMTDYILILDIKNRIHAKALCEDIEKQLSEFVPTLNSNDFYEDIHFTGDKNSEWIVLDLNSIIVHCISEEMNEFYKLDSLFSKYGPVFHA